MTIMTPAMPRMYAFVIFVMTVVFYSSYAMNATLLGLGIPQGWLWIFVFAGATFPMNLSLIRPDQQISRAPILVWAYAFVGIALLWYFRSPSQEHANASIVAGMWFILTLVLAFTMLRTREARRVALRATFWIVIVSTTINLIMAASGAYRPGGMYINPNNAGYALVMGMILTHTLVPSRFRFPYQIYVLAGIFVTASRGSLLLWGLSVVLLFILNGERQNQTRWAIFSMIAIFFLVASPLGGAMTDGLIDPGGQAERLLSLGSKSELEGDSRVTLAEMAIQDVQENFLLGSGTGEATVRYEDIDFGPHNMFLALMMQFGVIGFFIIPALILVLLGPPSRRWAFSIPFGVVILVGSLFSHTMLEHWHYAFAYALVARMDGNEFQPSGLRQPHGPYTGGATAIAPT